MLRRTLVAATAALLVAGLAAGCGSDGGSGAPPSSAAIEQPVQVSGPAGGGPPCTAAAIDEALNAAVYTRAAEGAFVCEGDWAFADATSGGLAEKVVLAANGPRWAVLDRATACAGRQLPARVRAAAC